MPGGRALEYYKLSLIEDWGHSLESQNADLKNADGKDQGQEVSAGDKDSVGSWTLTVCVL